MNDQELDVAIVGAGVSGCYAGFRLTSINDYVSQKPFKIAVFEQDPKIGGRLVSLLIDDFVAEMGGMRFFDQTPILSDLLSHLQLYNIEKFKMDMPNSSFVKRGIRIAKKDLNPMGCYEYPSTYEGKDTHELVNQVINYYLPKFNILKDEYHKSIRKEKWDEARKYISSYEKLKSRCMIGDCHLSSLTWYDFLSAGLSQEAVNFIQHIDGYEIFESCGSAFYWLDNVFYSPENLPMQSLVKGFQSLPIALSERIVKNGGIINLSHKLMGFEKTKDGKYLLNFKTHDKSIRVIAKKIILAMPKPALEMITGNSFFFKKINAVFFKSAKSVNAFKLILTYPFAWWEDLECFEGRGTTDLPLRQFYYFPQKKNSSTSINRPIMASYCNGPDADYWIDLINKIVKNTSTIPLDQQEEIIKNELKKQGHQMLMQAHNVTAVPLPNQAFYQIWDQKAGRAGWHVWDIGTSLNKVIKYMARPVKKEHIFIVGECWAKNPGSVQGALVTAEAVLQNHFELKLPEWMSGTPWDL